MATFGTAGGLLGELGNDDSPSSTKVADCLCHLRPLQAIGARTPGFWSVVVHAIVDGMLSKTTTANVLVWAT